MNAYTYEDKKKQEIVFECQAENILQADKMLEEKTGINPVKNPHIGCSIEFEKKSS